MERVGPVGERAKGSPEIEILGNRCRLPKFAQRKCGRDDWSFRLVHKIEIPETDAVADCLVFFSVFAHLREKESEPHHLPLVP